MDIDPDYPLYDEDFDDSGLEDDVRGLEEDTEDEFGPRIASAVGLGYHMAQDDINERLIAEDILQERNGKADEIKIPLHKRHEEGKGTMTPFGRWATRVNNGGDTNAPLEYTKEEQLKIIRAEGEGHD
jgi:hypothetical protein